MKTLSITILTLLLPLYLIAQSGFKYENITSLDEKFQIDSIKHQYLKSKQPYRMLVYQSKKDKMDFDLDSVNVYFSSILILETLKQKKIQYWIFTYHEGIINGVLRSDSVFNYNRYLSTGVLKRETKSYYDKVNNDPSTPKIMMDGRWVTILPSYRSSDIIYYEDNKYNFYFEDNNIPVTYIPLLEREQYRKEWSKIIHKELDLIIKENVSKPQ